MARSNGIVARGVFTAIPAASAPILQGDAEAVWIFVALPVSAGWQAVDCECLCHCRVSVGMHPLLHRLKIIATPKLQLTELF
jgi:hypothetical protein